jgi:hypothetical protein
MKRIAMLIALLVLFVTLGAQTGLFELSYGDDVDYCEELMAAKGFELSNDSGNVQTYVSEDNNWVDTIELEFDLYDGVLTGWSVYYNPQSDEDIEQEVLDILVEYHGDDYEWYDYDDYYVWDLENGHSVEAFWDWDYELFTVAYY